MTNRRKTLADDPFRSPSNNSSGSDGAALDTLLAQLAAATSAESAPSAVRQRLSAEARLQAVPRAFPRPRPRLATALAGALSAILLIGAAGAGASLLLSRQRFAATVHATLQSLGIGRARSHGDIPSPARDSSDQDNDDSAALLSSDVFALPYSDPAIANGTETTVRVSVPASQLMAWGVPSPARELDDQVAADLLLGDDGLPRAIRILPTSTTSSSAAEENYP
jgi:hypothetical protein